MSPCLTDSIQASLIMPESLEALVGIFYIKFRHLNITYPIRATDVLTQPEFLNQKMTN